MLISRSHWRIRQSGRRMRAHIYKERANRTELSRANPCARLSHRLHDRFQVKERPDLDSAAGWRRGRDSNPRYSLRPYDALAKRCLQPLGHLSGASLMHLFAWAGQFGSACFRSNIPNDLPKTAVCARRPEHPVMRTGRGLECLATERGRSARLEGIVGDISD